MSQCISPTFVQGQVSSPILWDPLKVGVTAKFTLDDSANLGADVVTGTPTWSAVACDGGSESVPTFGATSVSSGLFTVLITGVAAGRFLVTCTYETVGGQTLMPDSPLVVFVPGCC
jgi:hypothetical protein